MPRIRNARPQPPQRSVIGWLCACVCVCVAKCFRPTESQTSFVFFLSLARARCFPPVSLSAQLLNESSFLPLYPRDLPLFLTIILIHARPARPRMASNGFLAIISMRKAPSGPLFSRWRLSLLNASLSRPVCLSLSNWWISRSDISDSRYYFSDCISCSVIIDCHFGFGFSVFVLLRHHISSLHHYFFYLLASFLMCTLLSFSHTQRIDSLL